MVPSSDDDFLGLAALTDDVQTLARRADTTATEVEPFSACFGICGDTVEARLDVEEVFPHIGCLVGIDAALRYEEFTFARVDIAEHILIAAGGRNDSQAGDLFKCFTTVETVIGDTLEGRGEFDFL